MALLDRPGGIRAGKGVAHKPLRQLGPMCSAQTVAGMHKDIFIVATPLDDLGILHTLPELPPVRIRQHGR